MSEDAAEEWAGLVGDLLHGGCELFARCLHELTRWPVVALADSCAVDEDGRLARLTYVHVAVRAPDGRVVDAAGARPEPVMLAEYEEFAGQGLDLDWAAEPLL